MVFDEKVTSSPTLSLSRSSGDVALNCDQPTVQDSRDREASWRMYDEGCPTENPSVDDATGYSKEEEEALEEEASSEDEEVVPRSATGYHIRPHSRVCALTDAGQPRLDETP
jgi:hypothetical protein